MIDPQRTHHQILISLSSSLENNNMRVSAARTVCYERHVNASVASFQIQRRAQLFVVGTGVVTVMRGEGWMALLEMS
jgi:hypothetical protein